MRQLISTVVATATSLAVIGGAYAQSYTGHSAIAGSTTVDSWPCPSGIVAGM